MTEELEKKLSEIRIMVFICVLLLFGQCMVSCGSYSEEQWEPLYSINGIPICAEGSPEDLAYVSALSCGIQNMGFDLPGHCLHFIMDKDQQIPEICDNGCADTWIKVPDVLGVPARNPAEGYRGMCTETNIFVRSFGDCEGKERALMRHEYAHALGKDDDKEFISGVFRNAVNACRG